MGTLHRGGLKLFKKNTVTESIQMYKTKLACTQANKITWGYDNQTDGDFCATGMLFVQMDFINIHFGILVSQSYNTSRH